MAGVYVHLPFCPYLCPYCDFAKWPLRASAARRYLDALSCRNRTRAGRVRPPRIFVGGGTPNAYDRSDVTALARAAARPFPGAAEDHDRGQPGAGARGRLRRLPRCRHHAAFDRRAVVRSVRDPDARPQAHRRSRSPRWSPRRAPRDSTRSRSISSSACPDRRPASWRAFARGRDRARRRPCLDLRADGRRRDAVRRVATRAIPARSSTTRAKPSSTGSPSRRSRPPATSSTKSATSRAPDIAARTIPTTGRTASTSVSASAPRRTATASERVHTRSLDGVRVGRARRPADSLGKRAPGRPQARGRGDDAGAADRARGRAERLQRTLWHRRNS